MTQPSEPTILLVSDDAELCAAARRALETPRRAVRVTAAGSIEAARRVVENATPSVILLDHTSTLTDGHGHAGAPPPLNSTVAALAVFAPVVVIAEERQEAELAALLHAGAADFVHRGNGTLRAALQFVDERLQQAHRITARAQEVLAADHEDVPRFGEVLRHELNNPLTGILGNAELLLAEVRRKNDGLMPQGGQQRLETIAALAVRLRETVRRLSQELETHRHAAQ
jgi:signal transduction histidine kinase